MRFLTCLACTTCIATLGIAQGTGDDATQMPQNPTVTTTPLTGLTGLSRGSARQTELKAVREADPSSWLVPLHTAEADPEGGAYGIWAAGPDYKASFHDGFVFYPVLGPSYPRNLPLRWTTESITWGGVSIVSPESVAARHQGLWRFEYRHAGVTEAYDVLKEGVEQTFVLHRKLADDGDVVVTGTVTSELTAAPTDDAHQALVFVDSRGTAIVRYGEAFAFDAAQRRIPMRTSFDGQTVRLTLSGTWLADAVYPVTIDPMTSSVVIAYWGGSTYGTPSYPDVARDDETNELLTSYSRSSSASDYDTYARVSDDAFSGSTLIYTDVTADWSTRYNQCCFVGGADRWAIALGREFPSSNSAGVRVYVHDKNNRTQNSGFVMFLSRPLGTQDQTPSIGGTGGFLSGTNAYLAWRRDTGSGSPNTNNSEVWGATVDISGTGTFGTQMNLEPSLTNYDAEWPCVTKQSYGGDWLIVWQNYDNTISGDDWDVLSRRMDANGVPQGQRWYWGPSAAATHKVRPKVAGANGRYLVTFTEIVNTGSKTSSPWGSAIRCQRGDWSGTSSAPTKKVEQPVTASVSAILTTGDGNRGAAYDINTTSHWAIAWHDMNWGVHGCRTGYNGATVEAVTVYSGPGRGFSPSIVYNDDAYTFAFVWATDEAPVSNQPVYGASLQYFNAGCTYYGASCQGQIRCINAGFRDLPYAGSEFFSVDLMNGGANAPYALLLATNQANIPLWNNCWLLVGGFIVGVPAGSTSASGSLSFPLPLPDAPLAIGTIFAQYAGIVAGNVVTSDGVQMDIQ